MNLRLTEEEITFCEQFAAEQGIVALLDHLDLGGLANKVNDLMKPPQAKRIDIQKPLEEIANRLGVPYDSITHIDIQPGDVIVYTMHRNEEGKFHIFPESGAAAVERHTFKVST